MPLRHHVNKAYPTPGSIPYMPAKKPSKKPARTVSLKELGDRFRRARKTLKLSQLALGGPVGLDQTGLSRFENGTRGIATPTLLALLSVAAEKGMNVDGYVLRGVGDPVRAKSVFLSAPPDLLQELRKVGLVLTSEGNDLPAEVERTGQKRK